MSRVWQQYELPNDCLITMITICHNVMGIFPVFQNHAIAMFALVMYHTYSYLLLSVMERIIFKRVYNHLTHHALITQYQWDFLPGQCPQSPILLSCITISTKFWKEVRLVVFFDIWKEFDKVWHRRLLFKPNGCIRSLIQQVLRLHERQQWVMINVLRSDWGHITCRNCSGICAPVLLFSVLYTSVIYQMLSNLPTYECMVGTD